MDPAHVAKALISEHRTRDPFQIAEERGYIVIRAPLQDIRGFYHPYKRRMIIYVSEHLAEWEARFVCAHEIGHIMMHKGYNEIFMLTHTRLKITPFEKEADFFALELLFGTSFYCRTELVPEIRSEVIAITKRLVGKYAYERLEYLIPSAKKDLSELQL